MAEIEIGIMAHNEAGNLGALLGRLMDEPEEARICIVSSGSTDGTVQSTDLGRCSSTNRKSSSHSAAERRAPSITSGLTSPDARAVVIISGDIITDPGTLGRLVAPSPTRHPNDREDRVPPIRQRAWSIGLFTFSGCCSIASLGTSPSSAR